jgi:ribonuclease PH
MSANEKKSVRADGRSATRMRPVKVLRGILRHAEGSSWIRVGETQVLCAATVEEKLPSWLRGRGHGWVTAEYGMLPRSVPDRAARGRVSGRSSEIQRLIGRSLRAVTDLEKMPDLTITVDCDVLEADGGTRVAAVTAGWVALHDAFDGMRSDGYLDENPLKGQVAAISVGLVGGSGLLDLSHVEDAKAQVDLNVVGTADGRFVEVQGTAEGDPFDEAQMKMMLKMARRGLTRMFKAQERALALPRASGFDLVRKR